VYDLLVMYLQSVDWTREWFGIVATLVTLYSFSISCPLRFRQVNIVAAFIWVCYSYALLSLSMMLANGAIILLHVYHLYNHYTGKLSLKLENKCQK
jgi:hypothetical protein